jgi:ABC-type nitrate/sulfonate/bicarbonate transport system substrate-binding protein
VQTEQRTVGITMPASGSDDVSYEVLSRLSLKPGRYEIRVALDAAAAKSGSVYTYVDIPDFAEQPLSLSGVVFSVTPAWPTAPAQGFPDLLPLVPTTRRDFASTDRVSAFVRVYQKASEPSQSASIKAQLVDVNGRVVTSDLASFEADQFARNRCADYRIRVPIDRLSAGEYLLNIEATRAQSTVHRSVRFRVRGQTGV